MSPRKSRMKMVLKVKEHQEKKTQGELTELGRQKSREEDHLEDMKSRNNSAMEKAGARTRSKATDLQAHGAFLHALAETIKHQEKKLDSIEQHEAAKRQELIERSQEKKIVEKLDEKREAEEQKELERKRQGIIDMLAQRIRFEF